MQDDMHALDARRLIGDDLILGVSAGTIDEAREAEHSGADYVGGTSRFSFKEKKRVQHITIQNFSILTM